MQVTNHQLINDLLEITDRCITSVKQLKSLGKDELNYRESAGRWSILECLEHLNLYGDFYLPEIEKSILSQQPHAANLQFRSGLLGNYFANLMQAKDGKLKKMKSPKDKNPIGSSLTITTTDRFLKQAEQLKSLLLQSRNIDLVKAKTPISIAKFIRLRLGDTFRFYVYHMERHVLQAQKVKTPVAGVTRVEKVREIA